MPRSTLLAEDKTDVVVMTNGDHFVGENQEARIRSNSQFKASYMADSVNLDWDESPAIPNERPPVSC